MPMIGPDQVRGTAVGWARLLAREADRRARTARHAHAVARHERGIRRARTFAVNCAIAGAAGFGAIPLTHGWSQLGCGAAGALFAVQSGSWGLEARRRGRRPVPPTPELPPALPAPPPLRSAAWPALNRIEADRATLRRLAAGAPEAARPLLTSALAAARGVDDAARGQASRVAAVEAGLRGAAAPTGARLRATRDALVADLDRAAASLDELTAAALRLTAAAGPAGVVAGDDAAGALRAATDEAEARAYGLRVAASIPEPGRG